LLGPVSRRFAKIEVCVESLQSALVATDAGCDRLELCNHLALGGITPPIDLVSQTLKLVSRPVVVLIRPRPGDFLYDSIEQAAMIRSAETMAGLGVGGIAVGAIQGDEWDLPFMQQIAQCLSGCELVAHRAIDELLQPRPAADRRLAEIVQPLLDLGYHRILTSGGYSDAAQGSDNIRRMIDFAAGRIEILPGGGVTPENASAILEITGASQLHGSFQKLPRYSDKIEVDAERLKRVVEKLK
jgi:copper homeostasis protein